jgi:hypothetical protein
MTEGPAAWSQTEGSGDVELSSVYSCDQCKNFSVATSPRADPEKGHTPLDVARTRRDDEWAWSPQGTERRVYADVPDAIARVASEAHACASIGARTGAILLARTVVEATAKDQGVVSGNLVSKIDALKDKNLIRPGIAEAAHEIRHLGNDMAHGDLEDAPDHADADDVLALMAQVLSEVYQGPALVAKMRARRGASAG